MTLGSLFDGIGGFPLAATLSGITPVWASEVVPFCIAVAKHRFPDMKHLGNITEIDGATIPPVDVITFGSPCQDLSTAGQRSGLDGEQSGLFKEAIRIIYEMRNATNGEYPKFIVWENVPGAFSSNKGLDFQTVLEEIAQTDIPTPPSGRWAKAGMVRSERVSVAWRTFDAQHWGVPQRRKRIYLVGHFGTSGAAELLFECESLRGSFEASKSTWQGASTNPNNCVSGADGFNANNSIAASGVAYTENGSPTLLATKNASAVITYVLSEPRSRDGQPRIHDEISPILNTAQGGQRQPCIAFAQQSYSEYQENKFGTLKAGGGNCGSGSETLVVGHPIARRLTPLECERLQGYPDYWTVIPEIDDISDDDYEFYCKITNNCKRSKDSVIKWINKLDSDTARYKALGNSLAIPNALYVINGISEKLKLEVTKWTTS